VVAVVLVSVAVAQQQYSLTLSWEQALRELIAPWSAGAPPQYSQLLR
jgi:hypothetical protein